MNFSPVPYPIDTGNINSTMKGILDYLQSSWLLGQPIGIPTGMIVLWPSTTTIPVGYLKMGQTISRKNFAALFTVPNNTFGPGDGSTTFDLQNPTAPTGLIYIIKT